MQKNSDESWEIEIPNGSYTYDLVMGDPANLDQTNGVVVEGVVHVDSTPNTCPGGQDGSYFDTFSGTAVVTDGKLTITSVGASNCNAKICYIDIVTN